MSYRVLCVCVLLQFAAPFARAQEAGLAGTVTDATGAAVPQAGIAVRNVETGVERRTRTDDRGRYSLAPLAIGRYTLTAEAPGFRTITVSDIYLTIGQTSVTDVVMQVGQVNERITVADTSPLLQA